MRTLKPIRDRAKYSDAIAKKLEFELYAVIFKPVMDVLGICLSQIAPGRAKALKTNARQGGLIKALLEGIVAVSGEYLKGKFTAQISKEIRELGGTWDKTRKAWKIDLSKVPMDVKQAMQQAKEEANEKANEALDVLAAIEKEGFPDIDFTGIMDNTLEDLNKQFEQTAAEKLEIPMAMSGYIANELKDDYTENLNIYIKEWAQESIVRLRGQIQENSRSGYRADNMRDAIQAEYGVSERKAKFLARQETSLLVSKYREASYKEAGVPAYQWSTSHDSRVRTDHKDLNGEIFRWDSPPVVDKKRGRRAHPGEDFGCRCVAIPILASQIEVAKI